METEREFARGDDAAAWTETASRAETSELSYDEAFNEIISQDAQPATIVANEEIQSQKEEALRREAVLPEDALHRYLHDIKNIPRLSRAEEPALSRRVQAGKTARDDLKLATRPGRATAEEIAQIEATVKDGAKAKARMVEANLLLVVKIANKFSTDGKFGTQDVVEIMDIIQYGNIGLTEAVEKFDASKGNRFSTYAYRYIEGTIKTSLSRDSRAIRVPHWKNNEINKLEKSEQRLFTKLGREPRPADLAADLDVSEEKVTHLLSVRALQFSQSLDAPPRNSPRAEEEAITLIDAIADGRPEDSNGDTAFGLKTLREDLLDIVESEIQNEQRRDVIHRNYGFYGEPETAKHIAESYGKSREWVHENKRVALRSLRCSRSIGRLATMRDSLN